MRGTTPILSIDADAGLIDNTNGNPITGTALASRWSVSYIDSTNSTGSITYSTEFKKTSGGTGLVDFVAVQDASRESLIQVIEIS